MLKLGVLDQSPIVSGGTAVEAMKNTIHLAKEAERLGYSRYWVSEHHGTNGLAGSSPEVLISSIAANTSRIRVGTAGVLLPHYSPFKVAENFRVLEALYPGRIDLGLGRAPGGMPLVSRALSYGRQKERGDSYPDALRELSGFLGGKLSPDHPYASLTVTPVVETCPELWLLGSSDYSSKLAARLGAAFSFAHFINGYGGQEVVHHYLNHYRPGPLGSKPQANVCITVISADTDEEAERLASSVDLRLLFIDQGDLQRAFPSPDEAEAYPYSEYERLRVKENRRRMIVGGPESIKRNLLQFSEGYGVEELIVLTMAYDFQARLRSYELLAELFL